MRLSDSSKFISARRGLTRPVTALVLLLLVLAIAVADFFVVPNAPVSHLYYLPILLAAVNLGRAQSILVALLSVVLVHLADPELSRFHYAEADVMELLLFLTVAVVAAKLAEDARRLRRLASTDDLTGLHNLRSFEVLFRDTVERGRAGGGPIAMLCLDVDRLKRLNDTFGHLTGADAVKCVGEQIALSLPKEAFACRYGGDEFAIFVSGNGVLAGALALQIQQAVAGAEPTLDARRFPSRTLSVSIGVASAAVDAKTPAATLFTRLFSAADAAMYEKKRARPDADAERSRLGPA